MLWIGGPPGSGKTTAASILARRYGLRLYSADTRTWVHRDRAIAAGNEAAIRWEALAPDLRRMQPPAELLAMSLHRERGQMVVDDVRRLPTSPLIVAEGSVIRPADVSAGSLAVWLMPPPDAQPERLRARDGRSVPLYELLAEVIAQEVVQAGARVIVASDPAETVAMLEAIFADRLACGPLSRSVAERRALLRQTNLDIVEQVRGYYARPWALGNPEAVVRTFICECGATTCESFVETTVALAATRTVQSPVHP